jgi:hypothetical protein
VRIGLRHLRAAIRIGVDVVQVGVVLQVAFTRFVAGRAVERVIDQIHLQDELARILNRLGVGQNFHPLAERGGARFDQPAALAENLDRADAAGSPRAEQWLVTEIWNFDARGAGRFEDRRAGGHRYVDAVNLAGYHLRLAACHHLVELASHFSDPEQLSEFRAVDSSTFIDILRGKLIVSPHKVPVDRTAGSLA